VIAGEETSAARIRNSPYHDLQRNPMSHKNLGTEVNFDDEEEDEDEDYDPIWILVGSD